MKLSKNFVFRCLGDISSKDWVKELDLAGKLDSVCVIDRLDPMLYLALICVYPLVVNQLARH